jgi:hypothetical protein
MKQDESKFRSKITEVHLNNLMRTDISKMETNVNLLAEKRQALGLHE